MSTQAASSVDKISTSSTMKFASPNPDRKLPPAAASKKESLMLTDLVEQIEQFDVLQRQAEVNRHHLRIARPDVLRGNFSLGTSTSIDRDTPQASPTDLPSPTAAGENSLRVSGDVLEKLEQPHQPRAVARRIKVSNKPSSVATYDADVAALESSIYDFMTLYPPLRREPSKESSRSDGTSTLPPAIPDEQVSLAAVDNKTLLSTADGPDAALKRSKDEAYTRWIALLREVCQQESPRPVAPDTPLPVTPDKQVFAAVASKEGLPATTYDADAALDGAIRITSPVSSTARRDLSAKSAARPLLSLQSHLLANPSQGHSPFTLNSTTRSTLLIRIQPLPQHSETSRAPYQSRSPKATRAIIIRAVFLVSPAALHATSIFASAVG
ncbi:hypothetical protein BU16DRAFT_261084 [Lophium mytilinum]|uniref:Uncharacterized protein n=1 Tax=Lophium mytilinum TaxID=390894 RepID=A0A6A6R515_9PEZI|nr:hypothetical protein BU16DRAFT_261084 [Lophium mytilinum]